MRNPCVWFCMLVVLAAGVACATTTQVATPEEQKLAATLAAGKTWQGTWISPVGTGGQIAFRFSSANGGLQGEFLGSTGTTLVQFNPIPVGLLRFLEIKGGIVSFQTPIGADYKLSLVGRCLEGVINFGHLPTSKVKICPENEG